MNLLPEALGRRRFSAVSIQLVGLGSINRADGKSREISVPFQYLGQDPITVAPLGLENAASKNAFSRLGGAKPNNRRAGAVEIFNLRQRRCRAKKRSWASPAWQAVTLGRKVAEDLVRKYGGKVARIISRSSADLRPSVGGIPITLFWAMTLHFIWKSFQQWATTVFQYNPRREEDHGLLSFSLGPAESSIQQGVQRYPPSPQTYGHNFGYMSPQTPNSREIIRLHSFATMAVLLQTSCSFEKDTLRKEAGQGLPSIRAKLRMTGQSSAAPGSIMEF
ncbi:hypothetical protein EAF04_003954 [Stromatinia cepivora]|nr:hypothetical protein EAF04_003954 [Stromatinia cepivora]